MKKRLSRILISLLSILIASPWGLTWKETTHQLHLTREALSFVKVFNPRKYPEIWDDTFFNLILQGAHDEDFPCAWSGIRANNHYRHAISGVGLSCSCSDQVAALLSGVSHVLQLNAIIPYLENDPDLDALTWAKTNELLKTSEEFGGGKQWKGFVDNGWKMEDIDNGNMSWPMAINRYDYTQNSKSLAYYTLGFVLHLLQDMGCPEHVHDDPHGASGFNGFEMYAEKNFTKLELNIKKPKRFCDPDNEVIKETVDDYFINLSKIAYSVNRFKGSNLKVTKPHIDPNSDLGRMFGFDCSYHTVEVAAYTPNIREKRAVVDFYYLTNFSGDKTKPGGLGFKYRPSHMIFTSSKLKAYNLGEWWPTHLETESQEMKKRFGPMESDAPGYYYIELSGELPYTLSSERFLYPAAFLPTPLPSIQKLCPEWKSEWQKSKVNGKTHIYELISTIVFPYIIEYSAGFYELYYDIVNHPPFVKNVKVEQLERGTLVTKYYKEWKDTHIPKDENAKFRRIEKRTSNIEEEVNKVVGPGKAVITIEFSEPVKDVTVNLGNTSLSGSLYDKDENWRGEYIFPEDSSNKGVQTLSIKATDKERHYLGEGAELDPDPGTPAKRKCESAATETWPHKVIKNASLEYRWEGYEEGGTDKNHRIKLGDEDGYYLLHTTWPYRTDNEFAKLLRSHLKENFDIDDWPRLFKSCSGTVEIVTHAEAKQRLENARYKDSEILNLMLQSYITGKTGRTAKTGKTAETKISSEKKNGKKTGNELYGVPSTQAGFSGVLTAGGGCPWKFKDPSRAYAEISDLKIQGFAIKLHGCKTWDEALRKACAVCPDSHPSEFFGIQVDWSGEKVLLNFNCREQNK